MTNGIKRVVALFLAVTLLFTLPSFYFAAEGENNPITITFVVNNSNYTNDPGSGYTHLTSPTAIAGGDLTYNSWAGRYQVKGTGTLCSYDIPSGTTLSENGLAMPNLSVVNITENNTLSYNSLCSWLSDTGLVCGGNTVFTENTTLYLSLYQTGENYALDYVCCPEHNSSVNFYCGEISPTFKLGNSIPDECIYDYDTINTSFPSTKHDLTHFAGWQLKNTATGEYVPFEAGMPITADYSDSTQYGNAIKVYALWQQPAVSVTATFLNGEAVTETRSLNAGDALGTLPDLSDSAPEGQIFLGWKYTDADSNLVYADASTIISADTIYTAVFGNADYCNVIFHDIAPDGTEIMSIDMSVPIGTALASLEEATLNDGSLISACQWYSVSGETKTPVDFSEYSLSESIDLYTYSKAASFTFNSETSPALTLTVREGAPISASDFVVNDVDLTNYIWSYERTPGTSQLLNFQSLLSDGLTENISATSNGAVNIPGTTPELSHWVDFYVFIDSERVLLKSERVTSYIVANRRYLTAETLASVYGDYGFEASDLVPGTRYFPHVDFDRADIWADTPVRVVGDYALSPVTTHGNHVVVYYLPNQTITQQQQKASWSTVLSNGTDSFYTVKIQDPDGYFYSENEIPEGTCTLVGGSTSITVDSTPKVESEDIIWVCTGAYDGTVVEGTVNENGTVTFNISDINQPFVISPAPRDGSITVRYDINLPQTPVDIEFGTPSVEGESVHKVVYESDNTEQVILAPDMPSYLYKYDFVNPANATTLPTKYLGKAVFLGWAINNNTNPDSLIQPGTAIDFSDYGYNVNLTAQWECNSANNQSRTGPMVNFFVSLSAHPDEDLTWTGYIDQTLFTKSVYTDDCGVNAGIIPQKGDRREEPYDEGLFIDEIHYSSSVHQYVVLGSTSGANINARHNMLVRELTEGYTLRGNDQVDYTFQTSFPTDDMVMKNIREMIKTGTRITVNGHTVSADEMTAENFSVRWYVFKYDTQDGWHIDGVLVSKVGTMTVTKTFDGARDLITDIKNGDYSIEVTAEEGAVHTGETLTLENADSYNPTTDTYTWELTVDQFYNYYFTENDYTSTEHLAQTSAIYDVRNSRLGCNTGTWQNYTSAFTVQGQSNRRGTQNLTVNFLNTYVPPGTLILRKLDKQTGDVIPEISFDFTDSNNNPLSLVNKGNGFYDYAPSNAQNQQETTFITTNSNGQAFLLLPPGAYKLKERVPPGYEDPGDIDVVMAYNADTEITELVSAGAAHDLECISISDDILEVNVRNRSKTFELKAVKIWETEESKPVTLSLYRNGEAVGEPVVLDGVTDTMETAPWECVFTDLPLYSQGELAQYSIREERIGDFYYSSEFSDGYRHYDVQYSPLVYLDENGEQTEDINSAESALLTVTNTRSTDTILIKKVDENGTPLPGAVFRLYSQNGSMSNPPQGGFNEANLIGTATSDENGNVDFGTISEGTYYLIEYTAPEGYENSDSIFRIKTMNGVITLECRDEASQWISVPELKVVNQLKKTEITVSKTVSGWLGDRSRDFEFVASCSETMAPGDGYTLSEDGYTATFSLSHNQSITLNGLQKGAHLTLFERHAEDYEMSILVNGELTQGMLTVVDGMQVLVNNQKEGRPDIGVVLDTLPYILILAAVVAVAVLLIVRKRRNREDD